MHIICFGDSNTYGYDPRGYFGGRYAPEERWVSLLAEKTGWQVENQGQNGREIPCRAVSVDPSADLFIVMLGTNDLLQGREPGQTACRMEAFLSGLRFQKEKILLVAPPPMQPGAWVSGPGLVEASIGLANQYRMLAKRLGVRFLDAGSWNISLCFDGVHFTGEGHRAFAEEICRALKI